MWPEWLITCHRLWLCWCPHTSWVPRCVSYKWVNSLLWSTGCV